MLTWSLLGKLGDAVQTHAMSLSAMVIAAQHADRLAIDGSGRATTIAQGSAGNRPRRTPRRPR